MVEIDSDDLAVGCTELIDRIRAERDSGEKGSVGMHSVGGWHTSRFLIGCGWLGEAMLRRLEQIGRAARGGSCWGNVLPAGASYSPHYHLGQPKVAVWCLTDSGGVLHLQEGETIVVPDRAGQLVIFPGIYRHWVPQVERERITVAANL